MDSRRMNTSSVPENLCENKILVGRMALTLQLSGHHLTSKTCVQSLLTYLTTLLTD